MAWFPAQARLQDGLCHSLVLCLSFLDIETGYYCQQKTGLQISFPALESSKMGPRAHTAHYLQTQISKACVLNPLWPDEATGFALQIENIMGYVHCSSATVQRAAGKVMQLSMYSKQVHWLGRLKAGFAMGRTTNQFPCLGKAGELALKPKILFVVLTKFQGWQHSLKT